MCNSYLALDIIGVFQRPTEITVLLIYYMKYKSLQNMAVHSSEHHGKGQDNTTILVHQDVIVGVICVRRLENFLRCSNQKYCGM